VCTVESTGVQTWWGRGRAHLRAAPRRLKRHLQRPASLLKLAPHPLHLRHLRLCPPQRLRQLRSPRPKDQAPGYAASRGRARQLGHGRRRGCPRGGPRARCPRRGTHLGTLGLQPLDLSVQPCGLARGRELDGASPEPAAVARGQRERCVGLRRLDRLECPRLEPRRALWRRVGRGTGQVCVVFLPPSLSCIVLVPRDLGAGRRPSCRRFLTGA